MAEPSSVDVVALIDHHGAKLYRINLSSDQRADTIAPYDPHHFLHHLHHRDEVREHGQRPPEDLTFYDRIAEALRDVDRIVLLSHGTGLSNASNVLTERLQKNHPGIYARIVRQAEVNTSAMTEAEILAYGKQALATDAQRPLYGIGPQKRSRWKGRVGHPIARQPCRAHLRRGPHFPVVASVRSLAALDPA
jgi:hypothetical protein